MLVFFIDSSKRAPHRGLVNNTTCQPQAAGIFAAWPCYTARIRADIMG